eukprot:TRINITY_DN4540_c0_g1_i5.p1 TRINITY_DN4540_c0_g1~~TRINITY_DN4540_c0_g1_i5.p1  ORF type:complete len:725 (-),score=204.18 TRINITY_DN4540_c0_g1_i5:144-2318(-)
MSEEPKVNVEEKKVEEKKAEEATPSSSNEKKHVEKKPKAPKDAKKEDAKNKGKGKAEQQEEANPEWIELRLKLYEEYKKINEEKKAALPDIPIEITLPDGKKVPGLGGKTTPLEIAKSISRGLADSVVVAKVDGEFWDLHRALPEKDCSLALFKFDTPEGKKAFWHSSAHILGQALERKYGGHLTIGPAIDDGFYYDVDLGSNVLSGDDMDSLQQFCESIVAQKQPFERVEVPRDVALQMFSYNKFKVEIISKIPQEEKVTVYRCGPLIDLCRGPHVPNTSFVKAFRPTKTGGVFWQSKDTNPVLTRVYGVSFPDKKQLQEYIHLLEEAAKRDHRNVGRQQELFFFHPFSPGSCFMLPHGARIYNKLISLMKSEYHHRGFTEVISPNMYSSELWKTSGHWENYKENMFVFECDKTEFSLKPMNCPGHCLMFKHRARSYRELPIRFADFGVLHRNELAGALTGLTRVRRFQQDDAHIFCSADMIEKEIKGALEFMSHIYGIFGFEFNLNLSTRPEKFLGEIELWDKAEKALADVLNQFGKPWKINPGDGAFYGPKIDIQITDALKRLHQCATIQLDFQLPIRFGLEFQTETDHQRPVIIHRAILGSVERMMAILIEHTGGKWPFWLSPRQIIVLSISEKSAAYASEVRKTISEAGFYVDEDISDKTINKKVREAQLAQYNFALVVGEQESSNRTVNIRNRENEQVGLKTVDEAIAWFKQLEKEFK